MLLDGFLINVRLTTESVLEVELDASHLSWDDLRDLIINLESILHDINIKYSVRPKMVKGRAITTRHKRVKKDVRRRTISFSPFPERFTTILKNLRAYVYRTLIPAYCFTIEEIGKRKVYFLPKSEAPKLKEAIDDINRNTLDKLRKEIEEFRKTNEYFTIISLLRKYNIDTSRIEHGSFYIGNFMLSITHVDFTYSIDKDELYRTKEMQKYIRGLALLRKSIEKRQREHIVALTRDMINRIQTLFVGESYLTFRNKALIKRWIELSKSVGLDKVVDEILNPLLQIISVRKSERKKKANEVFGTEDVAEAIREKAKSILP